MGGLKVTADENCPSYFLVKIVTFLVSMNSFLVKPPNKVLTWNLVRKMTDGSWVTL